MARTKSKKKRSGTARKSGHRASPKKQYVCDECGLVVEVVDPCNCEDPCDLVCCGQQMTCR